MSVGDVEPDIEHPPDEGSGALMAIAASMEASAAPVSGQSFALALAGPDGDAMSGEMMTKFEAISAMFRSEVQVLVGKEKDTAREDLSRLGERNVALEAELTGEREEIVTAAAALHDFVAERQGSHLQRIFGNSWEPDGRGVLSAAQLRQALAAFLDVNSAAIRPELDAAENENQELRSSLEAQNVKVARLEAELVEARALKSQEERELAEFRALREKESEAQGLRLDVQQLQGQLEELQTQGQQLGSRGSQQEAVLREKSEKIIELVKRLESLGEQMRLTSDENNTLRLELGRDADYLKVATPSADPLSYQCAAGVLSEDLVIEDQRLRESLQNQASKFPGLMPGGNCLSWCELQALRVSTLYRSFLHRLQDYRSNFVEGIKVDFVSQTQEVDSEWSHKEEEMRGADAHFQHAERQETRKWEEHRLKLTAERDAKVKQLLEQAERCSQNKAEQQLLLHQAKLFGQRMDTQIERAWEDQRKERDLRWGEHQQRKQEARQRLRDESLQIQQRTEDAASISTRFQDMAVSKLASIEDAWLRNVEKDSLVTSGTLRGSDLEAALRNTSAESVEPGHLPARGSQHAGLEGVAGRFEELLKARVALRRKLRTELEDQSLRELRSCVERFIQREAAQQKLPRSSEETETLPDHSQANVIVSLLQMRQHRQLNDTLKRQYYDFLLILRMSSLATIWLMPAGAAAAHSASRKSQDLPPVPAEFRSGENRGIGEEETDDQMPDDAGVEGTFLYTSICQRLLERILSFLNTLHRDELLDSKGAYVKEQRLAVQHLCQLEPDLVDSVTRQDISEFKLQVSTRLLCDCECQLSEERKHLIGQVEFEVAKHLIKHKNELEEQEHTVVKDRRKWLTDRLVVLQANGAVGTGDRAVLHRLREELRACEKKMESFDNRVARVPASEPEKQTPAYLGVSRPSSGRRSARTRSPAMETGENSRRQVPAMLHVEQPSATGQEPPSLCPTPVSAQASPLGGTEQWLSKKPAPQPKESRAKSPRPPMAPASPRLPLPQFGGREVHSPDFGSVRKVLSPTPAPPLYELPFDASDVVPLASSRSLSPRQRARSLSQRQPEPPEPRSLSLPRVPTTQRVRPLDALLPARHALRHPEADPTSGREDSYGATSAGLCLDKPKAVRSSRVPPLLPPVHTPRS